MHRIIKVVGGVEVGITEIVNYIKTDSSGSFATAIKSDAIGTVFDSTPYNLAGHDETEGTETVVISEINGGTAVSHQWSAINETIQTILEG